MLKIYCFVFELDFGNDNYPQATGELLAAGTPDPGLASPVGHKHLLGHQQSERWHQLRTELPPTSTSC